MQTHRRFPLYARQFLNERELVVLSLKYSYFLLFIKVVLCLKGESHSFCSIKSSCVLQWEKVLEKSWVLSWNNFLVIGKQKFWSKSCVLLVLSAGCLCSRYGCFPHHIYHEKISTPGSILAFILSLDVSELSLKVINLFSVEKISSQ